MLLYAIILSYFDLYTVVNPKRIVIYLAIVLAVGYGIFVSAIILEGDGCIINCYEGEYKDGKWHGICLLYTSPSPRD